MHVPRRDRALVFREFALQTFTKEYLQSGVLLDVAGGKGDLSWLLANADGLRAVVIDPRPADHSKIERTAMWHHEHRSEDPESIAAARGPQGVLGSLKLRPPFVAPQHLRVPLDADLLEALKEGSDWQGYWEAQQPSEVPAEGAGTVLGHEEARRLLTSARAVLGFHPDEATEPCLDLALRLRVPFAIVPCCVFPAVFPDRRLFGRPVKTYPDFVEYLRRKHPGMQTLKLPFDDDSGEARNVALLMRPEDYEATAPPPPPLAFSTGRPAKAKPAEAGVLRGDLAAWAAGAATASSSSCGSVSSCRRRSCLLRAAAAFLDLKALQVLGCMGRPWCGSALLRFHEQPLPARRRHYKAERAALQEALPVLREKLEKCEGTDLFRLADAEEEMLAWKKMNADLSQGVSEGLPCDFSNRPARAEYFLRHLATRCWHLPHLLLAEEPLLASILQDIVCPLRKEGEGQRTVRVASLGGGPGYDAVGLAVFAALRGLQVRFEVANLDHEPDWQEVVRALDAELCMPLGHGASFGPCDISESLGPEGHNGRLAADVAGFHVFVVAFVVATNAARLEATDFAFFRELFAAASPGAAFFFMDATHRHWAQIAAAARSAGSFELALPKFERGKGLLGFPKHAMVLRKRAGWTGEAEEEAAASFLARAEGHRLAQARRRGKADAAAPGAPEEPDTA